MDLQLLYKQFKPDQDLKWLEQYVAAAERVYLATRDEFYSETFQQWLWELNSLGGIGFGKTVNVTSAYNDIIVVDSLWFAKTQALSTHPQERARQINYLYNNTLSLVTPRHNYRRPLARLSRAFAALFPFDVLCLFDATRTRSLVAKLELSPEPMAGFMGQHVIIRQRFRDVLGMEPDLKEAVSYSQFSWYLLYLDKRQSSTEVSLPDFGPAPIFVASQSGFDVDCLTPDDDEASSEVQKSVFRSIRRRVDALAITIDRIGNSHPGLAAEYRNYTAVLGTELSQVDVPALWCAGAGIAEFIRAFETPIAASQMAERLEPETIASFRALIGDHTNFILGFSVARKMLKNAQLMNEVNVRVDDSRENTRNLVRPIIDHKGLMSTRAVSLLNSLHSSLGALQTSSITLVSTSQETARNCLIAFGRVVHQVATHPVTEVLTISDGALRLLGFDHVESLKVAIDFFLANEDIILTFASASPQLSIWLEAVMESLHPPARER